VKLCELSSISLANIVIRIFQQRGRMPGSAGLQPLVFYHLNAAGVSDEGTISALICLGNYGSAEGLGMRIHLADGIEVVPSGAMRQ
jgi:hypothetical protein